MYRSDAAILRQALPESLSSLKGQGRNAVEKSVFGCSAGRRSLVTVRDRWWCARLAGRDTTGGISVVTGI